LNIVTAGPGERRSHSCDFQLNTARSTERK